MMRYGWTVLLFLLAAPPPAAAWHWPLHRFMMARTIELLPQPLRPFFEQRREELVLRVNDPDLWIRAGWEEELNHYLNVDAPEFAVTASGNVPRDWDVALDRFGMASLKRNGLLPWREAEIVGNLRRAFQAHADGVANAPDLIVLFAASAAHYVQDAYQPLHTTRNYDGQLTGQTGVHSRFEARLFDRFQPQLTIEPHPRASIINPRDFMFDTLEASNRQAGAVLDADRLAKAGREAYDDEYYDRFFARVKPLLDKAITDAIASTAAMIAGAWEQAGRPPVAPAASKP